MITHVIRDGHCVSAEKSKAPPQSGAFSYMPDIAPFTTHDGDRVVAISGRVALREYERKHGIRQIGDMAKPVTIGQPER